MSECEPVTVPVGAGDKLYVMNIALTRQLREIAIAFSIVKTEGDKVSG